MVLIGFTGAAGSGKDTAADMAATCFERPQRIAFADPIKAAVRAMLDPDGKMLPGRDICNDRELKEAELPIIGKSPRYIMQTLGTDWGRCMIHPKLWLIIAGMRTEGARHRGADAVIISDVRFENEASFIRREGGVLVHLRLPDDVAVDCKVIPHVSENGVGIHRDDYVITNEKRSLDDLQACVELVINSIKREAL